jgi:hypothetical protein
MNLSIKSFGFLSVSQETGESPSIFFSILFVELEISEPNLSLNLAGDDHPECRRPFIRRD